MSYHLRALERHGVLRRSPAGTDGHERRWRTAGTSRAIQTTAHAEGFGGDVIVALRLDRATRS